MARHTGLRGSRGRQTPCHFTPRSRPPKILGTSKTFSIDNLYLKVCYISREAQPRRNVYWSRASVCLCVCRSIAFPHYCMDQDVTWGMVGVPPTCALLDGFAIGARDSLLWRHSAEREMLASTCTCPCLLMAAIVQAIIFCPVLSSIFLFFLA